MTSSALSSAKWQGKYVHLLIFSSLRGTEIPEVRYMA